MEFRIGKNVKPQAITEVGEITFVSSAGVKPAAYTEDDCLAYGFDYIDSKCWSISNSTNLIEPQSDSNTIIQHGANNIINTYSSNSNIIGIENELRYNNKNNLVVGERNKSGDDVSNIILNGIKGEAKYTNSQVLGGNQNDDLLGERQSILLLSGAETTDATNTTTYINNDGSTLFNVEDNSIVSYTAHTIGVRTGGSDTSGAKGDFKYWIERGVVVSRGGTLTLKRTRDNIVSEGITTGWNVTSDTSGTNLRIRVKGKNNMDVKWIVRLEISEMRTGIDLS